jgi:hypothetical protein
MLLVASYTRQPHFQGSSLQQTLVAILADPAPRFRSFGGLQASGTALERPLTCPRCQPRREWEGVGAIKRGARAKGKVVANHAKRHGRAWHMERCKEEPGRGQQTSINGIPSNQRRRIAYRHHARGTRRAVEPKPHPVMRACPVSLPLLFSSNPIPNQDLPFAMCT